MSLALVAAIKRFTGSPPAPLAMRPAVRLPKLPDGADDRLGPLGFRQLGHGFEVVADLGQQAADVDRLAELRPMAVLSPLIVEGIPTSA